MESIQLSRFWQKGASSMPLYRITLHGIYRTAGELWPAPSSIPFEEVWPLTRNKLDTQYSNPTVLWRTNQKEEGGYWRFGVNPFCRTPGESQLVQASFRLGSVYRIAERISSQVARVHAMRLTSVQRCGLDRSSLKKSKKTAGFAGQCARRLIG